MSTADSMQGSMQGLTTSKLEFKKGSSRDRLILGLIIIGGLALVIGLAVGIPLSKRAAVPGPTHDPNIAFARTFLQSNVLIDGHNDLPWQYRQFSKNHIYNVSLNEDTRIQWRRDMEMTDESFPFLPPQTDIPRLREGGVGAVWWAAFVSCSATGKDAVRQGFDQVDVIHKFTAKYPETFTLALTAHDIETTFDDGKISSLIGLEGGHTIGNTLGVLRMYYKVGVRYMTLTHSCDNDWADNYKADLNGGVSTGLTDFGRTVVHEMNRLGMIIDVSHVSYQTMKDAILTSEAPVIFSHSSVFTLCNHYRNVQDDVLLLLKQNGGIIMINFYTGYIQCTDDHANTTTVGQVADHFDYVKNLIGIDHVAVGADYDGVPSMPLTLEDVSTYPIIIAELHKRNWSIEELQKVTGQNFLRVFRDVEEVKRNKSNMSPYEDILNDEAYIQAHNCTSSF